MSKRTKARLVLVLALVSGLLIQAPAQVEGAMCLNFDYCWERSEYLGGLASLCGPVYEYGACEMVTFTVAGFPQCQVWDHCYFVHESSDTCIQP